MELQYTKVSVHRSYLSSKHYKDYKAANEKQQPYTQKPFLQAIQSFI